MFPKRVLSLGQCSADHGSIAALLRRQFDAEVVPADTFEDARDRLHRGGYALVLVNRVLNFDGSSGLDFIREVKGDTDLRNVPVMVVSNHADAQQQAVSIGALPGFGKSALGDPTTVTRLRSVLGTASKESQ
jgi:two-component system chemotaxis response regulator CheY